MEYTASRILELAVAVSPARGAATLGDESVTFLQCAQSSARLANALLAWGARRHDRIVYWADISLRAIDMFFATSQAGAIFIPANPNFSRAEMDAVVGYLQPAFIVTDSSHQEEGASVAKRCGAKFGVLGRSLSPVAGFDLEDAMTKASDVAQGEGARGDDPNVMFLTSGSTGRPKAAILSHRAHWLRAASAPSYDAVCSGRGTACMFPLYHMAGWLMILQAFGRRRAVHLTKDASAASLWEIIDRHRPQELYCIPAVWRRIFEHPHANDGSCLTKALTGTSRVEPELVDEICRRFPNARSGLYYGSTEMGVSLGIGHEDIHTHPYSVGTPMPNVEARVFDGELLLRSDTMMDGYFMLPDQTRDVMLDDGWYRSGDLVEVDGDGFYSIVGRSREIIRSGGESIAPAEVEEAIAALPGIREVAVVGLPHEAWGEVVCAVLVLKDDAQGFTVEAIRSHLKGYLAAFKHPRMVEIRRAPLPRTGATGQIQRSQIKRELLDAKTDRGKG